MINVVIIGNSGAARECYQLFVDCWWASPTLKANSQFKGFLSYKGFKGSLGTLSEMELGDFDDYPISSEDRFIIGIGKPELRRDVFNDIKKRNGVPMTLISPWAYVGASCVLGEGNIVSSHCNFSGNITIGDGNYFNGSVRLGHDVAIGDFNFLAPSTTLLGNVKMGDFNLLAVQSVVLENAKIGNNNHIHPGSIVFKGCRNNCRLAGNPAFVLTEEK